MVSYKIQDLMKKTLEIVDTKKVREELKEQLKNGIPPGLTTGWNGFDEYYKFPPFGQLNIVTGQPGSGKSEWLDSLAINTIINHNWKILFYSPENNPPSFHLQKLVEKMSDKPFSGIWNNRENVTESDLDVAMDIIEAHCTFADCQISASDLDGIINTVILNALTDRVNMVIIDPWNKLETGVPEGMNKTDHIGKCLSKMQMVSRKFNIHFFVAAHPAKPQKNKDGTISAPSLYDISDSAHWFNMADNGFVVHRTFEDKTGKENLNQVIIAKIKDRRYGKCGKHGFRFLSHCSGFEDMARDIQQFDDKMF